MKSLPVLVTSISLIFMINAVYAVIVTNPPDPWAYAGQIGGGYLVALLILYAVLRWGFKRQDLFDPKHEIQKGDIGLIITVAMGTAIMGFFINGYNNIMTTHYQSYR